MKVSSSPRCSYRSLVLHLTITLLLCWWVPIASATADEHQKIKVALDWKHSFQFAGFYAAIDQGYFAEYGIEVELLELPQHGNVIKTVTEQEAHFGIIGSEMLAAFHNGQEITLVASYFKRSPLVILARENITSPKELEGSTIMGEYSVIMGTSLQPMLEFHQVDPLKINMTPNQANYIELFQEGKIDGVLAWLTNEPYDFRQAGIPFRIFDPNQFGIPAQNSHLVSNTFTSIRSPELIKSFRAALNAGWRYALDNKNRMIDLILSQYNSQDFERGALEHEANEIEKYILRNLYPIGNVDRNFLQAKSERLRINNVVPQLRDISDFIFEKRLSEQMVQASQKFFQSLTNDEKDLLYSRKSFTAHSVKDFPPYNFIENDTPTGYNIDYLELLSKLTGLSFSYMKDKDFPQYLKQFKSGELDVIVGAVQTEQRQKFARFTPKILNVYSSLVYKNQNDASLYDLETLNQNKRKVALIGGFYHQEVLARHFPDIIQVPVL